MSFREHADKMNIITGSVDYLKVRLDTEGTKLFNNDPLGWLSEIFFVLINTIYRSSCNDK